VEDLGSLAAGSIRANASAGVVVDDLTGFRTGDEGAHAAARNGIPNLRSRADILRFAATFAVVAKSLTTGAVAERATASAVERIVDLGVMALEVIGRALASAGLGVQELRSIALNAGVATALAGGRVENMRVFALGRRAVARARVMVDDLRLRTLHLCQIALATTRSRVDDARTAAFGVGADAGA
jgi:hypothetical protein